MTNGKFYIYLSFLRFWALPIEWKNYSHRLVMSYPTGYKYGSYHHHPYGFPSKGECVSNQ